MIVAGLLLSSAVAAVAADTATVFDETTNAALRAFAPSDDGGARDFDARLRLRLRLPYLDAEDEDEDFLLGLDCGLLPARLWADAPSPAYDCVAHGESASGREEDFAEHDAGLARAARSTALLVARADGTLSGVVKTLRGFFYEIATLPPAAGDGDAGRTAAPAYGFKATNENTVEINMDYVSAPEDPVLEIQPPQVVDNDRQRALSKAVPAVPAAGSPAPPSTAETNRVARHLPATAAADDDGSVITLLYHLTKRAMCNWSSQDYDTCQLTDAARTTVETMAAQVTTWGNVALANSNIAYTYQNAGVYVDMEFDEGTSTETLSRLNSITASPAAAALLTQYHADLFVDVFWKADYENRAAGIAWVPGSFPSRKYAFSSQVGVFSLLDSIIAHEVGHNMGLNHNREEYTDPSTDMSNYGYVNCDECFATIMSYSRYCLTQSCSSVTRVQYFSNTETQYSNFAVGDAQNNNKATMELSKVGVAMNRLTAPQLVVESGVGGSRYTTLSFIIFTVIAKSDIELNNIEFYLVDGDTTVELFTAGGSVEDNEMNTAFWGTAHVSEAITRASNSNSLIGVDVFQSFPTLSLSAGSTTNFKIQTDGTVKMLIGAAPSETTRGDVGIENDAMQITVGVLGSGSQLYSSTYGIPYGAFRYTVASAVTDTSASPSNLPSGSPSGSPSSAPSASPSISPSGSPSDAPSASLPPSSSPSKLPSSSPSAAPSASPSLLPSASPSAAPSATLSAAPSVSPSTSGFPSSAPSMSPSAVPSVSPSDLPSFSPSVSPSGLPSKSPSEPPSNVPSVSPSNLPSSSPSVSPSGLPSKSPSESPSGAPSVTDFPSAVPSMSPSATSSASPSNLPSASPSISPSGLPSKSPTEAPSGLPSATPSDAPSMSPSAAPSVLPSSTPTLSPSAIPSASPSVLPTGTPSTSSDASPSESPSIEPSREVINVYMYLVSFGCSGPLLSTDVTTCERQIQQYEADMQAMTMTGSVAVKIVTACTDNVCVSPPCGNGGRGSRLAPASTTTLSTEFTQTFGVAGNMDTPTAQQQAGEAFVGQVNLTTIQEAVETPASKELAGVDFTVGALSVTADFSNVTLSVSASPTVSRSPSASPMATPSEHPSAPPTKLLLSPTNPPTSPPTAPPTSPPTSPPTMPPTASPTTPAGGKNSNKSSKSKKSKATESKQGKGSKKGKESKKSKTGKESKGIRNGIGDAEGKRNRMDKAEVDKNMPRSFFQ